MHGVFHAPQEGHALALLGVAEAVIEATAQPAAIADQDLLSEEIEAQFLTIDLGAPHLPSQGSIVDLLKLVLKGVYLLVMIRWSQPKMGLIIVMVLE